MQSLNRALGRYASFGPLIIRVVLGVLFILHGFDKFDTGISNVEGFFDASGVPLPALTAPLVAVLEIVLGAALVAGFMTRLSALVLAGILAGAIIFVKAPDILNASELDLAYIAGLLGLVLIGPGRVSVDEVLKADETVIDLRSATEAPADRVLSKA
jgi:uncharacterized membrane protein YphA (DoxX/SURF4 family)